MTVDLPESAVAPQESPPRRFAGLPAPVLALVAGLSWWVVGFLPWILEGLLFPDAAARTMPQMAVPVYGAIGEPVLGAGAGGLAAGFVALLGRRNERQNVLAVAVGVAVVVTVTLVQSVTATRSMGPGMGPYTSGVDPRLVNGVTVIVVVVTALGLAVGLLALAGRVGLGIALAGVSGVFAVWIVPVVMAMGIDSYRPPQGLVETGRWVSAGVLCAALLVIGVRPWVRVLWWPVAIVLAWWVSPTVTASYYAEQVIRPNSGLPDSLGDHFSGIAQVWKASAALDMRPLTPWAFAVAVAAVVPVLGQTTWLRRRQ